MLLSSAAIGAGRHFEIISLLVNERGATVRLSFSFLILFAMDERSVIDFVPTRDILAVADHRSPRI
jgi:hypothetical protein